MPNIVYTYDELSINISPDGISITVPWGIKPVGNEYIDPLTIMALIPKPGDPFPATLADDIDDGTSLGAAYKAIALQLTVDDVSISALSRGQKAIIRYGTRTATMIRYDLSAKTVNVKNVKNPSLQVSAPSEWVGTTAIGIQGDSVNGVDVYRPAGAITINKFYNSLSYLEGEDETLTEYNRRRIIDDLSCTINLYANPVEGLDGYAAGELLFVGATIEPIPFCGFRVEYNFISSRTPLIEDVTFSIGGVSIDLGTLQTINGWDYVWTQSEDEGAAPGIISAHAAKVYPLRAWDRLIL